MTTGHTCRSCGKQNLQVVLSLGKTPLANSYLTPAQLTRPEPVYPLDLAFCPDCTLVQITEIVPPEILFREYLYFSSTSAAMLAHAQDSAAKLIATRQLTPQSLVIEIASNDGYLLKNFVAAGIPVLGIEPATNIAQVATERGVPTLAEFFGEPLARKLRNERRQADVIIGNNVLAHVADLNGLMRGVALLLKDEGVAQFEVPYLKDLIDRVEFDTIYHEHLCYFSLTALDRLSQRHGLRLLDVERLPIHGGSLRVQFVHSESHQRTRESVPLLLREETAWRVNRLDSLADFARRVEQLRAQLVRFLADLRHQGKRLAAYGAAAKGSTLLNYCGISRETIEFVVDRSPHKQGRYMPGVRIPILAPDQLLAQMPDHTLLLTWNFADEILQQQAAYRQRGGKFIIPVPEPRVV